MLGRQGKIGQVVCFQIELLSKLYQIDLHGCVIARRRRISNMVEFVTNILESDKNLVSSKWKA